MKKILVTTVLATSLLSTAAFAWGGKSCDRGDRGHHGKGGMPMMKMLKKVDLTDAQEDKIKKIMQERFENRAQPSKAFGKDGFDKALYIKEVNKAKENMVESRADMIEKVYAVLTPEQRAEIKERMDKKQKRMKERFDD